MSAARQPRSPARVADDPRDPTAATRPSSPKSSKLPTRRPSGAIQPDARHLALAEGDVHLATSLALADARQLVYRASWTTQHDLSDGWHFREMFTVPSASQPGQVHHVVFEHETMALRCSCVAGSFLSSCSHQGAVYHLVKVLERLMARSEDEARREAMLAAQFDEDAQRA